MATTSIWVGAFVLTRLFPPLLRELGARGVFGFLAATTETAVVFIWTTLPETKERALEAIERSRGG